MPASQQRDGLAGRSETGVEARDSQTPCKVYTDHISAHPSFHMEMELAAYQTREEGEDKRLPDANTISMGRVESVGSSQMNWDLSFSCPAFLLAPHLLQRDNRAKPSANFLPTSAVGRLRQIQHYNSETNTTLVCSFA